MSEPRFKLGDHVAPTEEFQEISLKFQEQHAELLRDLGKNPDRRRQSFTVLEVFPRTQHHQGGSGAYYYAGPADDGEYETGIWEDYLMEAE